MICTRKCEFGKGLFATKDIPNGTLITHYLGILIPISIYKRLKDSRYIMSFNTRNVIDGNIPCNKAKFINHSRNPNCEAIDGTDGIEIRAIRDIPKGEQLLMNYGYRYRDIKNDPLFTWYMETR